MALMHHHKMTLLAVIILLILLVSAYQFKHILQPTVAQTLAVNKNCDLRQAPCTSIIDAHRTVTLSITPRTLPTLQPLSLNVTTKGFEAKTVSVNIVGLNMDMGLNHPVLAKTTLYQFIGSTQIPVCTHNKMLWEAQVIVQTSTGRINVPFQFYTLKK